MGGIYVCVSQSVNQPVSSEYTKRTQRVLKMNEVGLDMGLITPLILCYVEFPSLRSNIVVVVCSKVTGT